MTLDKLRRYKPTEGETAPRHVETLGRDLEECIDTAEDLCRKPLNSLDFENIERLSSIETCRGSNL
jgi:hypothetical protein